MLKNKCYALLIVLLITVVYTSSAQEKIKILSYNVLYGLQKDSLQNIERYKKLILDLQPDVVASQEMNLWTQKSLEELARDYGHPYALQSKLEGFPVAISSNSPLVNFKKVTENMWHSYIYTKVKGVHIFVIHFSPFSYKKRLEEVRNIIAQAEEIPADEPILIMGDFNALDASDAKHYGAAVVQDMRAREEKQAHIRNLNDGQIDYSVLAQLKKAGFVDALRHHNNTFQSTVPTFKDGNGKWKTTNSGTPKRIDYIWCNQSAADLLIKAEVLKNDLTHVISDHYPMYLELKVK